ncbi:MAG: aminotransferase class I/II-fold pyridoxal phosphate-dependent enzyme, partial [Lachnospiraceae bacterium]|nr:aminotransferase class I/II-fold pyridoxal phosphate-dependent enzyme [Lachnospiraceae bacterium]
DLLIKDSRETLALVDKYESWMDGTVVKLDEDDSIKEFIPGKKFKFEDIPYYYKTVNIYKFSRHFSETHYVPFLEAYSMALGNNDYYEQVLRVITMLDDPEIRAKRLDGQLWYEIDDIQDWDIASSMFNSNNEKKLHLLQARYGGYWRYPKLIDFCYLVNPYFPPQKLMDEMKSNMEILLTQYPSGMNVNSLLAAKNFGVHQNHIVVGNGAAELIKAYMEMETENIGVIRPTFEEYPNRYAEEKTVTYWAENDNFSYGLEDLIDFFDDKSISLLILINPDNPSGNYIRKNDLFKLFEWGLKKKIRMLLDESFCDFADEGQEDATVICEDVINRYPNLIIVKSISKSYGVPGIRLGIMVSSDEDIIERVKKSVSIWNINSFGEFYMQIAEKYDKYYKTALENIKNERKRFLSELDVIPGIRAIPSQANYIMCEITNGLTSLELAEKLLLAYDIFIKDLSSKVNATGENKQYVRLAVRNEDDNNCLLSALKEIFKAE